MLLNNTQAKCVGFQPKKKGSKPFIIMPGINDIDDSIWKEFSKNPTTQRKVKEGIWKVVLEKNPTAKEMEETPDRAVELTAFEDAEAVTIIEQTTKHTTLERWLTEDARPKVQRALQLQLDKVGPTAEVKANPTIEV